MGKGIEIVSPLTLGADPELGYIKDGQQVLASSLMRNTSTGVGLDGHSDISEVRLKGPVKTPKEIVDEIRGYFKELNTKIPKDVIVVAGSMAGSDPIGGHIHFGNTKFRRQQDMHFYGERLDLYLALPALILENSVQAKTRRNGSYGRLFVERDQSAIETKSYGGFEYRALGSYLVSPAMTYAIIALAHTIVHEVDHGNTRLKSLKQFKKMIEIRNAFNNADKKTIVKYIPKIFADIQKCALFKNNYEKQIAGLFGLIKAFGMENKDWLADKDLLIRWGIRKDPKKKEEDMPEPVAVPIATAASQVRPTVSSTPVSFELAYNAGDHNLGAVVSGLSSLRYRVQIHIYGIRDDHGYDAVYYYNDRTGRLGTTRVNTSLSGIRMTNEDMCSRGDAEVYLGLSRTRRRQTTDCQTLIRDILRPFEVT